MALNVKKLLKVLFGNLLGSAKDAAPAIIDKAKDDLTEKVAQELAKGANALKDKIAKE